MPSQTLDFSERIFFRAESVLKVILLLVLSYWALIAILYPVTTWDSQVYNLSRLLVAEKIGFWHGTTWNAERQIIFPWTFDAVHYPLLKLGFGFNLPSYLTLVGILGVVYHMLFARYGKSVALWACLTVVSMPTIVLQATTSKNDLAVVFSLACWVYALFRHRKEGRRLLLFFAALALAFGIGSKTSGVGPCVICALITFWWLRRQQRAILFFAASFLCLVVLFGSVETYVLTYRWYQNPIGPSDFIQDQANHDGWRGMLANLIRYFFGNLSIGLDGAPIHTGFADVSRDICRWLLNLFHLGQTGYESEFTDETLVFTKNGSTTGSDFGIPGALGMLTAPIWIVSFRRDKAAALTAMAGMFAFLIVSAGVSWMAWNARFLCLAFTCFGVALAIRVFSATGYLRLCQIPLSGLIVLTALLTPFLSSNCKPSDLIFSVTDRERIQFSDKPQLRPLYDRIVALNSADRGKPWFLVADEDSWTLPFLQNKRLNLKLAPQWKLVEDWRQTNPGRAAYAVLLDQPTDQKFPGAQVELSTDDYQLLKLSPMIGK